MANVQKWLVPTGGKMHTRCFELAMAPSASAGRKPESNKSGAKSSPPAVPVQGKPRSEALREQILRHLTFTLARDPHTATSRDWWISTAMAVRDHVLEDFIATMGIHYGRNVRRVYFLSLEYLMGRLLEANLHNTGLFEDAMAAVRSLGLDFQVLRDAEEDMGLGNGGLGRLAACFLDSLATHDYPAIGYGIHYEFGLFKQEFVNGHQVEHPDNWIMFGDPWEIVRPEYTIRVQLYGEVVHEFDDRGNSRPLWVNTRDHPRGAVRHADCGLRNANRELPPLVGVQGNRGIRPGDLQQGGLCRSRRREDGGRDGLQGSVSE